MKQYHRDILNQRICRFFNESFLKLEKLNFSENIEDEVILS